MSRFEFSELIVENFGTYLLIFILSILLYYIVLKKIFISLIDPFFLTQIFSFFAFTVAIFLWVTGTIKWQYGLQFLLTQIAFWIGLHCYDFSYVKSKINASENTNFDYSSLLNRREVYVILCLSILFVFIQLFVYYRYGVPLFMQSRLSMYEESGGGGMWGRILSVLAPLVLVGCLYIKKIAIKYSLLCIVASFFILFVASTYLLSGSKGQILTLFSVYLYFLMMYEPYRIKKVRKLEYWAFGITFGVALYVLALHNSAESSLLLFIDRLVGSGDIFYQGYFQEIIESIKVTPWMILNDMLGTFRIVSWEDLPKPIGMQIYAIVYNTELPMGPNARHNYLGLLCFGTFGSILFSYFLGRCCSFVRTKFYKKNYRASVMHVGFYIYILFSVCSVETDFTMFIASIDSFIVTCISIVIIFIIIWGLSVFIGCCEKNLTNLK
ncbi:hypothetical protein B5F34_16100 [Mediterranea sp. An20]|uniref:oligosaccharide repeat unit polymerase n=1 Tax=Mediterranea sp. An20 TaxID=1965586 RepID=UPI000B37A1CB|nr:oligosaccharide repeat unit polymerase [Mediterranea sp. An20]OUP05761.1 hypothetical protein B5F34_16100 [Mediterranea sp. An20]